MAHQHCDHDHDCDHDHEIEITGSLELYIADKSLSSWGMRAWLVAIASGIPFKEKEIKLYRKDTREKILKHSPSGRLPALKHGDLIIWDSLAIAEYLNELSPYAGLWPKDMGMRAMARSYVSEMHSGFTSLRQELPMDLNVKTVKTILTPGVISDIERILTLWKEALKLSKGPYLFGEFGIVDAFFAPVVFRFLSYGVEIKNKAILQYMDNIQNHAGVEFWLEEVKKEKIKLTTFK
ncbi:glutathione S-transferase, N-terminal domain protein [Bacteriovorax sp. BSW11_IV]|uniref:glutathione S-transferase family protein n=1 Tax=Bacteriovorax sp. BSW11_IV TaxID=1353529 RepID=UPI00038A154C|nr:glutathione S-transferase family protein [Bacteriovorax sp. BSW11_IV]EQC44521.1 glutathione S-transferase, N-terminal domain protein [Bacteriovorax sp. BSW11_IV]